MKLNVLWIVAATSATLYCLNLWFSVNGFYLFSFLLTLLLSLSVIAIAYSKVHQTKLPYITFILIFGFPEYAANPYLEDYQSPFSLSKIPALISLLMMLKLKKNPTGLGIFFLLLLSTTTAIIFNRFGILKAEIWYVLMLLIILHSALKSTAFKFHAIWLGGIERLFYLLPLIATFIVLTGLFDQRSENTLTLFYGHWLGIITTITIYLTAANQSTLYRFKALRVVLMLLIIYMCAASYQSVHFILFFLASLLATATNLTKESKPTISFSSILILLSIPVSGYFVLSQLDTDSWIYLKFNQIVSLYSGTFLETSNSVTIRVAQFLSLIEQGDIFSILFGRGVASIYLLDGSMWDYVILHEGTFPENQILTGRLQYIHESLTMIFKWIGITGLLLLIYFLFIKSKSHVLFKHRGLLYSILFILLFSASSQAALIVTILFLTKNNSSEIQLTRKYRMNR